MEGNVAARDMSVDRENLPVQFVSAGSQPARLRAQRVGRVGRLQRQGPRLAVRSDEGEAGTLLIDAAVVAQRQRDGRPLDGSAGGRRGSADDRMREGAFGRRGEEGEGGRKKGEEGKAHAAALT